MKKLTNGKREIEMNTTDTNENTEQKGKPKAGQLLETMDLRDYFAAKAMQGIMNSARYTPVGINRYEYTTAKQAYQMADAMLEARK